MSGETIFLYELEVYKVYSQTFEKTEIKIYDKDNAIEIRRNRNKNWEYKKVPKEFFKGYKLTHRPGGVPEFYTKDLTEIINKSGRFKAITKGSPLTMAGITRGLEKISYTYNGNTFSKEWVHPLSNMDAEMEHVIEICNVLFRKFDLF